MLRWQFRYNLDIRCWDRESPSLFILFIWIQCAAHESQGSGWCVRWHLNTGHCVMSYVTEIPGLGPYVICHPLYLGRIWWKLQTHNFILKMYFLACAYHVVFITDQFWIKDFFGKNVIFWPKNAFFSKNWQFDPLGSAGQQSCFRIFCLGTNILPFHEKKYSGTFRQKMPDQFFYFYPNIFGHISSILGIKQVLDNKF